MAERAATVRRLAERLGFSLLGIASARASEHAASLQHWLEEGRQGEMAYLADRVAERLDPCVLVPGARSVICVADGYTREATAGESEARSDEASGRIARYAWGDDYHRVMKRQLHALADAMRERWPEHTFRSCVDTAPVLEREHAVRAGLGWMGKNTMLIHPRLGSYFLLGEIITTLTIQPDSEAGAGAGMAIPIADHCGGCTRCIDACPTHCIEPYHIDASRCISYLTIEHRGAIEPAIHESMGNWLAGCDVCQEVCPFNGPNAAATTVRPQYRPRPPGPSVGLMEVLGWDADARRAVLERSALKRIKLEQMKRNALIAAGNHLTSAHNPLSASDRALLDRIKAIAVDEAEHALVRQTAGQVLTRLNPDGVS